MMMITPKHVGGIEQTDIDYIISAFCWFLIINYCQCTEMNNVKCTNVVSFSLFLSLISKIQGS
jgi:hypothetical protein